MLDTARLARLAAPLLALLAAASPARAEDPLDTFITGQAAWAWDKWQTALDAITSRDNAKAEAAFGELLAKDVSPLRLALLGDRAINRANLGGPLILMEQDFDAGALGPNAKAIYERYQAGVEQLNQADDALYFSLLGNFPLASANFQALLAAKPDPVALLEFVDRDPKREKTLVLITTNPIVGQQARETLKLLGEGERRIKADPTRIQQNIERLGGPPRQYENSVARLKDSGEFAVPFLIMAMRDPEKQALLQPILRTLPQLDRAGLNPLVQALRMQDNAVRRYLIEGLGKIGYYQAIPYLIRLREAKDTPPEIRAEVEKAINSLMERGVPYVANEPASIAFYKLADGYYRDVPSLQADPRLDVANVWYWRDNLLQNVEVPTPIFNEIMAMRCAEEALAVDSGFKPALALWLAANFRREAQLPVGATDPTRPENYPSAVYFAQSAGPEYALMALARAIQDGDAAVALGAIEALRNTAGPASVMPPDGRQPLADALSFADRMVRIRAALALAAARPMQAFPNSQNLLPVLGEALTLSGGARTALVIDPDDASANSIASALRADGFTVVIDGKLGSALDKVKAEMPGVDAIALASNVPDATLPDAVRLIRGDPRFAALPLLIIAKPDDADVVRRLTREDYRLGDVPAGVGPDQVRTALARVARAVGASDVTPALGLAVALEAADVLRELALANPGQFSLAPIEPTLLTTLTSASTPELRVKVADLLALVCTRTAQAALARLALEAAETEPMREAAFAALAESGKRCKSLLDDDALRQIIQVAESEPNLRIRTAASRALGALNLPGNPASEIIRKQSRG